LPPPSKEWERDPSDGSDLTNQTRVSFVGSPATIKGQIEEFVERTRADELIAVSHIYDHRARLRSYELAASVASSQ
jgi:alkanesulfonate monooxygenase SsuD/methylene tetrahydromethanopterin reductase-like flavin-dependent oxidoreductase (luciferase family)